MEAEQVDQEKSKEMEKDHENHISVSINGHPFSLLPGSTVQTCITAYATVKAIRVVSAVFINSIFIPKDEHCATLVKEGDHVNVISFLGGG
jgi:thiamine biosynthesis protein ThiS